MPLQRTLSFFDLDENQPENTNPLLLSSGTPDTPAISLRLGGQLGMRSLGGSASFNSLRGSSPATNQSSMPCHHPGTIPYQCSLQYYKNWRKIEKAQRNEAVSSPATDSSAPTLSAVLHSPPSVQPPGTNNPSIFKPPVVTKSSLRQSSPLGPCQYSLPGRPMFPPSVRELNLYRQVLKKSARQTKLGICHTGKKPRGVEKAA